ncbi:hypothetical protein ABPG77_006116 [Micractinium sp. CCAP 211/92]
MGAANSVLVGSKRRRSRLGPSLLKLCRAGDADKAAAVLAASPSAAAYCTLEGLSSLHVCAVSRRTDLLEQLLVALHAAGSGKSPKAARRALSKAVNQKNVHGQTPLMLACRAGAADCVRLLLEAGADATLFDDLQQRTCLHYAAVHGWAEAIDALLEDESVLRTGEGQQQQQQQQQQPTRLRDAHIPDSQGHHRYIDGRDGYGLAALHLAASHGHLAAVKALLKWGASLAVRCNSVYGMGSPSDHWAPSSTPLHYAAASGRGRVVQAILQAAAERQRIEPHVPDIRLLQDFRGQRPYDVAVFRGHRQLLWALDPRVPLAALLQQPAAAPAVPRLAALAAAALRRRLNQQLGALPAGAAGTRAGTASTAAAAGGACEGSRRGRHSGSAPSQEVASPRAAAHAAARGLPLSMMARLSGGCGGGNGDSARHGAAAPGDCGATCPSARPQTLLYRHASLGSAGRAHRRGVSDSGVLLRAFQPEQPALAGGGVGGSWRGGTAYASLLSGPQLLIKPAAGPAQPLRAQLSGGGSGCALADMAAAAGSILGRNTATSVTSAAGKHCWCPVCLDSSLEVAASPCGHGLCLECAQHLSSEDCAAAAATPPLCPLCRGVMGGFWPLG